MKKTETKAQNKQPANGKNGAASDPAPSASVATPNGIPVNGMKPEKGEPYSPSLKVQPGEPVRKNPHGVPDYRLEVPNFHTIERLEADGHLHYEVSGDFDTPVPPIRESKYLDKAKSLELYRWMLLNRKMEQTLEVLFKQQKVIGGVYLGFGQEGCSCASALALSKEDWIGPMIRNQGAMLVRGFKPRDTMMQYMAKRDSPTHGRESGSHYGDSKEKNVVAPISHLGDSISVLAGVALGARYQGKNIAALTWVGDGGNSTGPVYEGFNFAAVQRLGLILIVEHNLWAYSTPVELQFATRDLANRAIGYGVPGAIVDGTDPNQVYDITYEAVQRAYRGEGATLIEAKMMRMRGHAMHDAALYVPKPYFEYWKKRDCVARYQQFLRERDWLSEKLDTEIQADVQRQIDEDRDFADKSPFPDANSAGEEHVFCDNSAEIPFKYGGPKVREVEKGKRIGEASSVSHYK